MSQTNYHTQKSKVVIPKRSNNPPGKKSVPVDKGLNNFFRGTRLRKPLDDQLLGEDGQ